MTISVGGGSGTPDIQDHSVKRMRRISVASGAAIDVSDGRLGSGTIWAKSQRRELGVAGDAKDAQ